MSHTPAATEHVRPSHPGGRAVRVREPFDGVPHTRLYQVLDSSGRPVAGPRLAIVAHMHGNEPVGRYTLDRFDGVAAEHLCAGEVLAIIANPEAAALNLRHTPEGRDLNRLWDRASIERLRASDGVGLCFEERRALELYPLLESVDGILDLHSTSRPSSPHLVFRDDLRHASIAVKLGVSKLVTGVHEGGILDGGLCSSFGLAPGEEGPLLGFTLEAGQHENRDNDEAAWRATVRLLHELGMWDGPLPEASEEYEVYEVLNRFRQAPQGAVPYRFVGFEGGEPGEGRFGTPRLLESFEHIEADEVLLRRGDDEVVRARAPFTMLMPAPTAGPGGDLFYYTRRRHAALRTRPQTDESARTEARAIEQALDLLARDQLESGTSRVTFTAQLTLDSCADIISRVCRLPPGHPHRTLTVVGRGDWAEDEGELRAGRRYQAALRRALEDGVPVERVQLLRGASSAWLRHLGDLSDHATAELRIRLSINQPHTISLLVAGDLERARERGSLRHVTVGLIVEAATVERGGDGVHTRIARTGLFGSRPELVRTAQDFLGAMRNQHRHLMATSSFGMRAMQAGLVDPEGALVVHGAGQRQALSEMVIDLQHEAWRASLRHEVTREVRFTRAEDVGAWLARTMAATGVLDACTLQRWLVVEEDGEWIVDPSRLELPLPTPPPVKSHQAAPVVLDARDVDRENIERWMSWLRAIRGVESIPGTRGKNVDIAFKPEAIQDRIAGWYEDVRRFAAAEPGRWMVVIAGDGASPHRDGQASSARILRAHRELLQDPAVQYVRVQHAQGTHLSWLKGFLDDLRQRPPGGRPVALGWEAEHGATVNVVMLARTDEPDAVDPWSLDGVRIVSCAVVVSDLERPGLHEYQVALFTGRQRDAGINRELLAFGRAHCRGLLRQASWKVHGLPGPFLGVNMEKVVVGLIGRHIERARELEDELSQLPTRSRAAWLGRRLGLLDLEMVDAVAEGVQTGRPSTELAHEIWRTVRPWSVGRDGSARP